MTIELHSAAVLASGKYGRAARTSAGFVVLGTTDAQDLLDVIAAHENSPSMVERLSDEVMRRRPRAFSMVFTAGGEPYLLAWGETTTSVSSTTTQFTIKPVEGQLCIEPLRVDVGSTLRITNDSVPSADTEQVPLEAARADADTVVITVAASDLLAAANHSLFDELPTEQFAWTDPAEEITPIAEPAAIPVGAGQGGGQPAAASLVFADDEAAVMPAPVGAGVNAPTIDLTQPSAAPTETPLAAAAVTAPAPAPEPSVELATPPAASAGPVMVLGVVCPHGHHNHPEARFCSVCGTAMTDQLASVLISGPRPPLGVLVVDDGATLAIDHDVLIGRVAQAENEVRDGTATPLTLTDVNNSVSRRHARIVLDEWRVLASDLGSSNGTWLNRGPDPLSVSYTHLTLPTTPYV